MGISAVQYAGEHFTQQARSYCQLSHHSSAHDHYIFNVSLLAGCCEAATVQGT